MNNKKYGYEKIFNQVLDIFNYDRDRAIQWWVSSNIHLENKAPYEMVKEGKGDKLMKIIRICE